MCHVFDFFLIVFGPIGLSQPSVMSAVITGAAPFQTERPSGLAEVQEPPASQATEAPKIPSEPLAATTPKSPRDTSAGREHRSAQKHHDVERLSILYTFHVHYGLRIYLSINQYSLIACNRLLKLLISSICSAFRSLLPMCFVSGIMGFLQEPLWRKYLIYQ